MLAIMHVLAKFRQYLVGHRFWVKKITIASNSFWGRNNYRRGNKRL